VPLALARQRLMTATFPYYELKEPNKGPAGDFVYTRKQNRKGEEIGGLVPHIMLQSIANNEEPKTEMLVDRPEAVSAITRVSGPFTVEATMPAAMELEPEGEAAQGVEQQRAAYAVRGDPSTHVDRMIHLLRQSKTLRLPGNRTLSFESVRAINDADYLHAEAVEENGENGRVAVVFGPEHGAIGSETVYHAAEEAKDKGYTKLYFFGLAIQAKAREMLEDRSRKKLPCVYVEVAQDVFMSDLLKTTRASQIFSITGLPDIEVVKTAHKNCDGQPLYQVKVKGLDLFNPASLETESVDAENLPCWMLDTDYDGYCFYASQVFFPKTSAWDNLKNSLGATFDDSVWAHLAGTESEPFALGEKKRIAVKIIDERGHELPLVREVKP
jgi:adenine-specific DNA-methyltransferase